MRIVLHRPEIAANFGNILRTAACFALPVSVIEPIGFPLSTKDVRRAAMDYGAQADLSRHASWAHYRDALTGRRVLFTTSGSTPLSQFAFQPGDHLVFGSESSGVPDGIHADCDARVLIPLAIGTRSLNLSNTVAIAAFEALRQTGTPIGAQT